MKPSRISIAMLVVFLFLAPAVSAQSPDSGNQSAASPALSASAAEVPRLIKFSGTLLDAQDRPLAGPVGVTFALHSQQSGGAALWMETQNVEPDARGMYTILLGANSAKGVPAELFASGEARWLEVQVERQAAQPRVLLVSVPYALKAGDAQTLGGKPASAYLTTETLTSAGNSAAAATATAASSTPGALPKTSTATTPKKAASTPRPSAACSSLTSGGAAPLNAIAKFTGSCSVDGSAITETGGKVGIGTTTPAAALHVNGNTLLVTSATTAQLQFSGSASTARFGQDLNGAFFASDSPGKAVRFYTNNGTLNEGLRVTSAGNVGIGTQTPAAKLDVNGNLNLPNTTSATVGVISLGGHPFAHNFGTNNTFLGINAGNFTMTGGSNTATGQFALNSNATGVNNTASGEQVLFSNTTGSGNTASGTRALQNNTTGGLNTASGMQALLFNTTGFNNTASGSQALLFNTTGIDNTASGQGALLNNTTGDQNTADGAVALTSNTTGTQNTATGEQALFNNTTGSGNTALGFGAGFLPIPANANTTGSNNTFIGSRAGPGTPTQLSNATAIGANALVSASNSLVLGDGTVNVGIGTTTPAQKLSVAGTIQSTAGGVMFPDATVQSSAAITQSAGDSRYALLGATSNTFTGSIAASSFSGSGAGLTGVNATTATSFTGSLSGEVTGTQGATVVSNAVSTNTANAIVRRDGSGNFAAGTITLSGNLALPNTTSATVGVISLGGTPFAHNFGPASAFNTFLGQGAGNFTMAGTTNTDSGAFALEFNTTGSFNSASGADALQSNTTGNGNTAMGTNALRSNTTANNNTAVGVNALTNSTGVGNTAVGGNALALNTTAAGNTAIGASALNANTAGNSNTAVGSGALQSSTASGNIAIGTSAGLNLTTGSNNIYLGHAGGAASESNAIRIGTAQTATFIAGISGATSASGAAVFVNGAGQLGTVTSSRRYKEQIADLGAESDVLMKLRPVSFYYKPELDETHTRQYGLVAEEVAQLAPDLVVFDKDGAPQTVRYHFVNAMLLNEVQKQRKANQEQQSTIARQQAEIQDFAGRLARLEALVTPGP